MMIQPPLNSWSGTFGDLAPGDQHAFAQLVKEGRAIVGTVEQIIGRLEATRMVALLREESSGRIAGVAALKTPTNGYRAGRFAKAGVPLTGFETAPELGYVVVAENRRGQRLSGMLVELIAAHLGEAAYATTDDRTMRNNLTRAGFTRVGVDWPGQKAMLSLWTITPR